MELNKSFFASLLPTLELYISNQPIKYERKINIFSHMQGDKNVDDSHS